MEHKVFGSLTVRVRWPVLLLSQRLRISRASSTVLRCRVCPGTIKSAGMPRLLMVFLSYQRRSLTPTDLDRGSLIGGCRFVIQINMCIHHLSLDIYSTTPRTVDEERPTAWVRSIHPTYPDNFFFRKEGRSGFPWINAIMRIEGSSRTACSGCASIMKIANQQSHLSWLLVLPGSWAMLRLLGARSRGLWR